MIDLSVIENLQRISRISSGETKEPISRQLISSMLTVIDEVNSSGGGGGGGTGPQGPPGQRGSKFLGDYSSVANLPMIDNVNIFPGDYAVISTSLELYQAGTSSWNDLGVQIALRPLGNWNSASNYSNGQIVSENGSSFVCFNPVTPTSPAPTDPTADASSGSPKYWQFISKAGSNGNNGSNGISPYSAVTANFTLPAVNSTVSVTINPSLVLFATNQPLVVYDLSNGNQAYVRLSSGSFTSGPITLLNTGWNVNGSSPAAPGTVFNANTTLIVAGGEIGASNSLSIGTVTTLSPGSSATATITGTTPSQVLNLGIPQGAAGSAPTFDGSIQTLYDEGYEQASNFPVHYQGTADTGIPNTTSVADAQPWAAGGIRTICQLKSSTANSVACITYNGSQINSNCLLDVTIRFRLINAWEVDGGPVNTPVAAGATSRFSLSLIQNDDVDRISSNVFGKIGFGLFLDTNVNANWCTWISGTANSWDGFPSLSFGNRVASTIAGKYYQPYRLRIVVTATTATFYLEDGMGAGFTNLGTRTLTGVLPAFSIGFGYLLCIGSKCLGSISGSSDGSPDAIEVDYTYGTFTRNRQSALVTPTW